jgi:hypothetical protein
MWVKDSFFDRALYLPSTVPPALEAAPSSLWNILTIELDSMVRGHDATIFGGMTCITYMLCTSSFD